MEEENKFYSTQEQQENEPSASAAASDSFSDDFQSCCEDEDPFIEVDEEDLRPSSPPPSPHSHSSSEDTNLLEQLLFFACGLGSSLGYIATLSSLVYFKILYGPDSFVDLNLAVYLPLLPISLAQARWDRYYDQQYQSRRTFLVRGVVGFGLILLGTIRMILNEGGGLALLIWQTSLQGSGGAILYGTLNQLASFVGRDGRRLKATVSAGVQASALVVLAVSLWTGFRTGNADKFSTFLWSIATIETLCFAMFLWLLLARQSVAASMIRRDSSIQLDNDAVVTLASVSDDNLLLEEPLIARRSSSPSSSPRTIINMSFAQLWNQTRACCLILIVTLVPSFVVGSWFTRVQTDWIALAQVLFYVRIGADFFGRLATIVVPPRSIPCLGWAALGRLVPTVLFFINARAAGVFLSGMYGDILSIVLVAIISFLSGYLVTGCFQLAPLGLPSEIREMNSAKQASLLTVAFSVAAIGGLVSSFVLIAFGV
jgi:hypothetical protein